MTKEQKHIFYADVDPYELACRILEGELGVARPAGKTPKECIEQLPPSDQQAILRGARRAFDYFQEVMAEMKREQ